MSVKQKIVNKKLAIFFICVFLLLQLPAFSVPWNNKKLPPINTTEKLSYVNIDWWNNFNDPILTNYIYQAVEKNHDAKIASWKVEEYRQFVKKTFGQELPSLSIAGNYIGAHWPEHIKGVKSSTFIMPITAKYEADIFLKNHDKTKSSKKTYEASKQEEKAVYIALAADVATVYLNILQYDKQIQLQQKIVEVNSEKFARERKRFDCGVVGAEQLNNVQKELKNAQIVLDDLIKIREKSLTQLAVLVDENPETPDVLLRGSIDKFDYRLEMPKSVSSDVIFSRPDVMAVETKLEKAKIDVRVARKEFLPTIDVTGFYTMSNLGSAGFGSWESTIAAIVAGATLDLFKGGTKVANLKIYKSRYEQMFEEYKQTDLNALKEVGDSLYGLNQDTSIDKNSILNLSIQTDNYNRALKKYKNGVISYPELLMQKEKLLTNKKTQVTTKTVRLTDYFTLYKAVGGQL